MASVYDSFRDTAKSLLNDYGKDAVLVRGVDSTNITIFELGRKKSQKRESNLHFSGNTQLVETSILIKVTDSTDVDFNIENGDVIVFDSYKWQIKDYDTVVGDKNVIYKAVIQRGDISDPITPNPPLTGTELTAFQTHLLNTTDAHGIDNLGIKAALFEHVLPVGEKGNQTLQSAWTEINVNTLTYNGITNASLSNDRPSLPDGTYKVEINVSTSNTPGIMEVRLFDGVQYQEGINMANYDIGRNSYMNFFVIKLTSQTEIILEAFTQNSRYLTNPTSIGSEEKGLQIFITKLG